MNWFHPNQAILRIGLRAVGGFHRVLRKADASWQITWLLHNAGYRGHPDDVFVVTFPKSGTTLMQMLLFQLMTDGDVEKLSHIRRFCPFLERDVFFQFVDTGATLDALPRPRVVKSHLPYRRIPKGPGRYIYVIRNGLDVAVSLYYQLVRTGCPDSFPDFFRRWVGGQLAGNTWFDHMAGWVGNRDGLTILYVTYEDLLTNFEPTARRVAEFCGLDVPESQWKRIAAACSFEVMRRHEDKFDDLVIHRGDPEDLHFIRRGQVGGWHGKVDAEMFRMFSAEFDRKLRHMALPRSVIPRMETSDSPQFTPTNG